ncbi:CiaD-like domain-containing protein [Helicobacter cetorum]|uniref:Campylobacter invasion antigen D C-terminal domain-containing protein n=1 Tax=Helicobacter cetorum (strain ATCC BAA-540 / CCUG 52418 / MIT 99-5656) TaxID=1163745 RepID=I0ERR6_HELCM|nr:hypothetical protein [Helicobacter cetorum]AFI05635.1 hypothetical protein HCD_03095 [Helicobacter cetorum MIT 99-5656]
MELKNIISETLNEIQKVAKTIDDEFDVTKKVSSFFKTPPCLQNAQNTNETTNTTLEQESVSKTNQKMEKEEETQEKIIEETITETSEKTCVSNEQVFLKDLLDRTLVLFKGMQALEPQEAIERLDLVVHFLEYQLSVLEKRLEFLEQEPKEC